MMLSICSRYEHNRQDASARMNEGFLKVLLNLEKRRPEVPFEAWVRRIMITTPDVAGYDTAPLPNESASVVVDHENLRGPDYYMN